MMRTLVSGMFVVAITAILAGCAKKTEPTPKSDAKPTKSGTDDKHSLGAGPHGGALADWGGGKYHVEFTVDHDKQEATVYILGADEKTTVPIKAKDGQISANIKGLKNKDTFQLVLKAAPQPGDPEGKASRFVGKHEKIGVVQEFAGTITGEFESTPYSGDFEEKP
jgi:hypothetical protein